jgi:hypothetical protein
MEDVAGVTAVLCLVPVEDFQGPAADDRLQDLSWVGPRAVRHAQVIEWIMQYSPVIPAPFGTLFSTRARLQQLVKNNFLEISTFLNYVANKEEWAVKGWLARAEARDRLFSGKLAAQSKDLASVSPGLRYFKERQIRAQVERDLGDWLKGICSAIANELAKCSIDSLRRNIIGGPGTNELEMVANWAFLVDRSWVADFKARIERANVNCGSQGLSFAASGPWPPYSFSPPLEIEPEA